MSSGSIFTYLPITAIRSRCSACRKSGSRRLPVRSRARMICSRSFATLAVFFFSPSRKDRKDDIAMRHFPPIQTFGFLCSAHCHSLLNWIMEKAREFQKNIYFCFTDYAKAFDCMDHNKLWKILKEMGIPGHLTCLLRNLYAGQEATARTRHGTTDWFQIGKGIRQGCILSPCLFNLYTEYIMRNTGLEESQARIKIAERNSNNLRYADDTTLMAESEEELKSLLIKVKVESEKVGLKLNIQKIGRAQRLNSSHH